MSLSFLPEVRRSGCMEMFAFVAAASGEKMIGRGPTPPPSLAIGLVAVQAANSTARVVSFASLASLRRALAVPGRV